MRLLALSLFLAGVTSLPVARVAAQDTTLARPGDHVRIAADAPAVDSMLRGRLSWSSADSFSVFGHGRATTLSITALRSVDVRRRPRGFTKRTVATSAVLGLAGGAIGAHLGSCAPAVCRLARSTSVVTRRTPGIAVPARIATR